jgi:putative transposase
MEVSSRAFYTWLKTPEDTEKAQRKLALETKARQLFNDHKQTYGYRQLSNELGKAGITSGHYQVRHLMVRLGLKARYPKRFKVTTNSGHNEAISPNGLDRQFDVVAPNQVWTTDITYIWTLEGWLYLAVVIDLFSRQVVGWAVALVPFG